MIIKLTIAVTLAAGPSAGLIVRPARADAPAPAHDEAAGGAIDEVIVVTGAAPPPAAPTTVIDRAAIERSNASTAADVLALVPGLALDGPHNARDRHAHVRVRGFEPRYTLVLVDGRRVTGKDSRGVVDLSTIPAAGVERIEVIKGPHAARLGGDAIGGVINVVTRRTGDRSAAEAFAGYGSFDTRTVGGRLAARAGALGLAMFVRHERSDGWSDAHDLDRTLRQITARSDPRRTVRSIATAALDWERGADRLEVDPRVTLGQAHKRKVSTRYVEEGTITGDEHTVEVDGGARWTRRDDRGRPWIVSGQLARLAATRDERRDLVLRRNGRDVGSLEAHVTDLGVHWTGSASVEHRRAAGHHHWLVASAGWRSDLRVADNHARERRRDPDGLVTSDAEFRDPGHVYRAHEGAAWLAVEDEVALGAAWSLAPAIRVEWQTTWGGAAAPSVAAAWRPATRWIVRAAAGLGWETPSLEARMISVVPELDVHGDRYVIGNPELVPERSLATEAGVEYRADPDGAARRRWSVALNAFRNDFRDKLVREVVDDWMATGLPLEREINLGRAVTQGVEVQATWQQGRASTVPLAATAAYTYLWTRDGDTGGVLDRVAPHAASVTASGALDRTGTALHLTGRWSAAAPRVDASGAPRLEGPLPPLWLAQLRVEQRVGAHVVVTAQIDNLLAATWDKDADGDTDLPPPSLFVTAAGRL